MDWIKVKVSHVLYEGFNKNTLWAWLRLMSLTAQLEKTPTAEQMRSVITKREQQSLEKHLAKCGQSVGKVLAKCCEDVAKVQSDRNRKRDERLKLKGVLMPKTAISSTDSPRTVHLPGEVEEIRGEEIRGEEIRGDPPTPPPLPPSRSGGVVDKLLLTWKTCNPLEGKVPGLLASAEREFSAARVRGVPATEIEQRIYDTAGQGIKPWELFPKTEKKDGTAAEAVARARAKFDAEEVNSNG